MATTTASITEQIIDGKTLPITDKELRFQSTIKLADSILVLNLGSVLSPYKYQLKKMVKRYKLNAKDALKYQYKPWALSYDLYGTIEMAPMILQINGMISSSEFCNLEEGIYLFTGAVFDFINEVLIKEQYYIRRNRTSVKKELSANA